MSRRPRIETVANVAIVWVAVMATALFLWKFVLDRHPSEGLPPVGTIAQKVLSFIKNW